MTEVDSGFTELLGSLLARRTWVVAGDVFLRAAVSLSVAGSVSFRGWKKGSLTLDGALCAFAVGLAVCFASARMCVAMLVFFWTSSWLTKLGSAFKAKLDDTHNDGRRGLIQVLCNGGIAATACTLWLLLVLGRLHALQELAVWESELQPRLEKLSAAAVPASFLAELELRGNQSWQLVEALHWSPDWMQTAKSGDTPVEAAWMPLSTNTLDLLPLDLRRDFLGTTLHLWGLVALAAAAGDTWASELGVLFPGQPVLLLPPRRVPRGTNGAISLAGTVASGLGGLAVGSSFFLTHRVWSDLVWKWDSRFATHGVEHVTLPPELVPPRRRASAAAAGNPAAAALPWYGIGPTMRHGAGHYYQHLPDTLFKNLLASQAGAPPAAATDLCERADLGDPQQQHQENTATPSTAQSAQEWILRRQRTQRCGPLSHTTGASSSALLPSSGPPAATDSHPHASSPPAQWHVVWVCGLAGFLGSFIDSVLGALFQFTGVAEDGRIVNERRQRGRRHGGDGQKRPLVVRQVAGMCACMSNNAVNFASILITPVLIIALILWMEAPFVG